MLLEQEHSWINKILKEKFNPGVFANFAESQRRMI
jgi:hypothetical protein